MLTSAEILDYFFRAKRVEDDPWGRWTTYQLPHSRALIVLHHRPTSYWRSEDTSGDTSTLIAYCQSIEQPAQQAAEAAYRSKRERNYRAWVDRFHALGKHAVEEAAADGCRYSYRVQELDYPSEFHPIVLYLQDLATGSEWTEARARFRSDGSLEYGTVATKPFTGLPTFKKLLRPYYPTFSC